MSPCQKNKVRVYVPYSTLIALTNEIRETPVGEFLYLFIIISSHHGHYHHFYWELAFNFLFKRGSSRVPLQLLIL